MEQIFFIIIFLYSVIAHEVAHGKMAEYLGDPTARLAGRLTLNPLAHIDPIGSVLLPLLLFSAGSPILFGWAKPVPYNPYNLGNYRYANALVAGAGVGTNLAIAIIFGIFIRLLVLPEVLASFFAQIVLLNLVLGVFNLVPIPPLDGSKILFDFLGDTQLTRWLERYGVILLVIFIVFGFSYLTPLIEFFYAVIVGY